MTLVIITGLPGAVKGRSRATNLLQFRGNKKILIQH